MINRLPLFAVTGFVATMVALCLALSESGNWVSSDATADWLAATAARLGLDPYGDLRAISEVLHVPYDNPAQSHAGDAAWTHPRTPGALLLLQPLTLMTPAQLYVALGVVSVLGLAFVAWRRAPRITGHHWAMCLTGGLAVLLSRPMLHNLTFGSMTMIVACLVWAFWETTRNEDSWIAGIPLGVAISLRVFPALLIFAAVFGRRPKAAISAVGSVVATTTLGMLLFGISVPEMISGIGLAGRTWMDLPTNGSMIPRVGSISGLDPALVSGVLIAISIATLGVVSRLEGAWDLIVSWALVLMLLVSPLSWEAYDLILLIPLSLALVRSDPPIPRFVAYVWLAVWVVIFSVMSSLGLAVHLSSYQPALSVRIAILTLLVYKTVRLFRHRPIRVTPTRVESGA